jgi:hypothetical protein
MSESIQFDILSFGQTFSLALVRPKEPPPISTLRRLPPLPYNTPSNYTLISGLQVGYDFDTQLWLAQADYENTPIRIVFKFFIPSLMDPLMLSNPNAGLDRSAKDVASCQKAAFDCLWDFQGTAVPWFFWFA